MSASSLVEVAVAILMRSDNSFLLASRPAGKPYSGYWEFPGGKIEAGETPLQALSRELDEELGVSIEKATPWLTRIFRYPHAMVRLRFYRVTSWQGKPVAREQQQLIWQTADKLSVSPLLPACIPVLRSLRLPPIYAITHATEMGMEVSLLSIQQTLQNGLKLLQIREKAMPRGQLKHYTQAILQLARYHQATILLNQDIVLAQKLQTDGVHLTATQLLSITSRPAVNWCGASCHNPEELKHAEQLGIDFVTLSPVLPTLSHPNAEPLGWDKFSALIQDYSLPVYALGGLQSADLVTAQEHGAHGIAMMRGI
jgi:8-oxo-dGTP diphosphatase